jgi:ABC-2 type transport system permease protein
MSTESNATYEALPGSQRVSPAIVPPTAPLYWSVRRELWENRSIYLGAPAVALLILAGIVIGFLRLTHNAHGLSASYHVNPLELVERLYSFAALGIMAATFLVAIFYCLDALHGERRDRSILFWKSLPVSDLTTVVSKAIVPVVLLPLITFATTVVTQGIILIVSSIVMRAHGASVAPLWDASSLFQMWLMLLFHLVAIHGFWYAPIYGWLMLVSAWARRAPFLWAVLPALGLAMFEKIAFTGSDHFGKFMAYRLGGPEAATLTMADMSMAPMEHIHLGEFLMTPGLWIGLAVAAAFLAAAIQLRRYRGPL